MLSLFSVENLSKYIIVHLESINKKLLAKSPWVLNNHTGGSATGCKRFKEKSDG
jgi:hypothetical protein